MDYKMDGLAHIGLVVKNTEQTVAFYTQQLGFQKVAEKTIQTENGTLQVTFLRNGGVFGTRGVPTGAWRRADRPHRHQRKKYRKGHRGA